VCIIRGSISLFILKGCFKLCLSFYLKNLVPKDSEMGGARVRMVEAHRHIGALLLPQSKVPYVPKGQREVGGEVRLKGSHRKKKRGVAMQLRISCRHASGTLGCATTTPEPHVCAVVLRHSLQLWRSQSLLSQLWRTPAYSLALHISQPLQSSQEACMV
jgi:hypothetical protein